MPNPDTPLGRGCGTLLFLAGGVIAVGAVLLGVGARLAVGGALPRLPLALSLPLAGLLVQQAQALAWGRWARHA